MGESVLGNQRVTQVALVVNDIVATSKKYAELFGIEPPQIIQTGTYDETQTEFEGKPSEARSKLAFFNVGENLSIELIEPDMTPSVWRNYLNEHGEGLHHIAFEVKQKGMKNVIDDLDKMGIPLSQKGEYQGGRYAYVDAQADLKLFIELLEND